MDTDRVKAPFVSKSSTSQTRTLDLVPVDIRYVLRDLVKRRHGAVILTWYLQICQFCYNNIKTHSEEGRCPNCRRSYDDSTIQYKIPDAEE